MREQLHRRYDPVMAPREVDRVLDRTRHRFEGRPVRTFVPILVERSIRGKIDHRG